MKPQSSLWYLFLFSSLFISCNKDDDTVTPKHMISSDQGVVIELEWNTGGSSSLALRESDLDLYLDLDNSPAESSQRINSFEEVHLRDVFKNGTYEVYIGAIEVSRKTSYNLYIYAPDGGPVHHYTGYFLAGEEGELHYLNIKKDGRHYTLVDL